MIITDLELFLTGNTPLLEITLQTLDGVLSRAHALDLLTRAVGGSRIGHTTKEAQHRRLQGL